MTVWAKIEFHRFRASRVKVYVVAGGDGCDSEGPFVWQTIRETYKEEIYQDYATQAELEKDGEYYRDLWQCNSFEQIEQPPRTNYDNW